MKKTIVIFGGSGGLGSQISKKMDDEFNVVALGSKDVDVTDKKAVDSFFATQTADIVINLSGINFDCFMHKYNEDNHHKIDELLQVNLKGVANIISGCLPGMRERKFGRIVLISSILAESPVVSTGIYAGCKGFMDSLAKTVALENAGKGVTCNSIQLGYFDGGLTYRIPEDFREKIKNSIPLKRFGSIDELVSVIKMLVDVEYMTGVELKLNGGLDF